MTGHFSPFSPHFCRKTGLFRRCIYFVQKSNKKNCKKQLTRQRFCAIIFYVVGFLCKTNYSRGIAQLVEQWSPKPRAQGSSPCAPAIQESLENVEIQRIQGFFIYSMIYIFQSIFKLSRLKNLFKQNAINNNTGIFQNSSLHLLKSKLCIQMYKG